MSLSLLPWICRIAGTWLATVLEQLWPFAKVGLEQMLRDVLDPILADAANRLGLGLSLGFRQLQVSGMHAEG